MLTEKKTWHDRMTAIKKIRPKPIGLAKTKYDDELKVLESKYDTARKLWEELLTTLYKEAVKEASEGGHTDEAQRLRDLYTSKTDGKSLPDPW